MRYNTDFQKTERIDRMAQEKRIEARRHVFELLFEREFRTDETPEEIFDIAMEEASGDEIDYIRRVYFGVCEKQAELDALIERFSNGWKPSRMSRVSRSILRLCIYEMQYVSDVPDSVAINEAVELSKSYAEDKARPFINGILNSVKNELSKNTKNE